MIPIASPHKCCPSSGLLAARLASVGRGLLPAVLSTILAGCATTHVSEKPVEATGVSQAQRLTGRIEYAGNPLYLPQMLQAASQNDGTGRSEIVFRYEHDVSYDVPREHALTIFNPFLIVGVPKSSDTVVVKGALEVMDRGQVLKRYDKTVTLGKNKTVFSEGDTLTEMRRQGLLLVRDHIDRQLMADEKFLRMHGIEK